MTRWFRVVGLLLVGLCLAWLGLVGSSPAQAAGERDELYVASDPGNFGTQGVPLSTTTLSVDAFADTALFVSGGGAMLNFQTDGAPFAVGRYDNVGPASASGDGLRISINGGICDDSIGSFEILELVTDGAGGLTSIAIDFAQNCDRGGPGIFGSLRINSAVAIDKASLDAMTNRQTNAELYMADVDSSGVGGSIVSFSGADRHVSASAFGSDIIAQFNKYPAYEIVSLTLETGGVAPSTGVYSTGGASVELSGAGAICGVPGGSFEVFEVEIDSSGQVQKLAVDFVQECTTGVLRVGSLRINSSIPIDKAGLDDLVTLTFLQENPSDCPEMTDSIYRLYLAYFGRNPDIGGWNYWNEIYPTNNVSLANMSQAFAFSPEFINTYGSLSNADFVRLVYVNVLGREPDPAGLAHWTSALDNGYERGSLMISFSESTEFIIRSNTVAPLSGYLTWYDPAVQYSCGTGLVRSNVNPMPPSPHADVVVWNFTNSSRYAQIRLVASDNSYYYLDVELPPNTFFLDWNLPLDEFDAEIVVVQSASDVYATVVIYDHPHSSTRSPYSDAATAMSTMADRIGLSVPSTDGVVAGEWTAGR